MSKVTWRRPQKAKTRRAKGDRDELKPTPDEKDVFVKYGQKLYEYDPDDLDDEYDDR